MSNEVVDGKTVAIVAVVVVLALWWKIRDEPAPADPGAGKIADATLVCERHAKAKAANPSSVNFSLLMDRSGKVQPDGTVTIFSSFTARNAFNAEQKFKIYCLVAGDQVRDSEILPAQ